MSGESVPFFSRVLTHFAESGWEDWLAKLIVAICLSALGGLALWVWKKVWPHIRSVWAAKRRLDRALTAVAPDSSGLWLSHSMRVGRPSEYDRWLRTSKPIIVVANLKGGVGKTTLTANLIAHYAIKKGERVLGIDLDFQGSLTASALTEEDRAHLLVVESDRGLSKAAHLIDDRDAAWLRHAPDQVAGVPNAKLISAYYSLAAMENRVMVEWLLGKRNADIRYHLAEVLHNELIQNSFDRILIDAPPRLTTASIQAFCAATHVLIPTVLDELSTEAVAAFAEQLKIHQELWPRLKLVGVVGTMTAVSPVTPTGELRERPLTDVEVDALASGRITLKEALSTANTSLRDGTFMPIEAFIPDKTELSRAAGHRIVYASPSQVQAFRDVRDAFDRLGDEIDRRIAGHA